MSSVNGSLFTIRTIFVRAIPKLLCSVTMLFTYFRSLLRFWGPSLVFVAHVITAVWWERVQIYIKRGLWSLAFYNELNLYLPLKKNWEIFFIKLIIYNRRVLTFRMNLLELSLPPNCFVCLFFCRLKSSFFQLRQSVGLISSLSIFIECLLLRIILL